MTELDYPTIQAALQRIGQQMSPAEYHGQLCGVLSSVPELSYSQWLQMALPELLEAKQSGDALAAETDDLLQQLFSYTEANIVDHELGFHPLLLDDDETLSNRMAELADWCSGFLLGLSMGGIKEHKGLPGDIPEFLQDLLEISRAGSVAVEDSEEDESSYVELIEYVRMGVMLVRMELHQLHTGNDEENVSIH